MSKVQHFVLVLALMLPCLACPQITQGPGPDFPTADEAKDCAKEGAKDQFYNWLPQVNTILAMGGTWGVIVNELMKGVGGFGINGIECLIAKIGADAAGAASADPGNVIAGLKQERAAVLLEVLKDGRDNNGDQSLAEWFEQNGADKAAELTGG